MSLLAYICTYLLGGLTFVPLCVLVFYFLLPVRPNTTKSTKKDEKFRAGEIEDEAKSGVQALKAGWVTVTHEYWQSTEDISLLTQAVNDSTDNKSAYSSLYKLANKADEADSNTSSSSSLVIGPGSPTSDEKHIKGPQKRHRFYAVLKHGNLFLYKDATVKDVKHVIVLSSQVVTIWPRGIADSQLFTKNSAICIMKKDWSRHRRLLDSFDSDTVSTQEIIATENKYHIKAPKGSVFLYCDHNIDKEDWYFALIRASKSDTTPSPLNPNVFAKPLHFATDDMIDMIQTLYSAEGQLHSKWFNAITGRLFLALQRTPAMSAFLENRIAKKLNKIKTPGFLDKFQIKKIDPGTSIPFFTYPSLKEVSPDGTLVLSVCVHYHGAMAIQIATKANLKLGSTFKPREVDLLLSVTLEKLEGQMIIKFKPPPSDRIWYTFETEPTMDLKIEPIISSRQFNYNIITSTIGKKFKEAIRDSLVSPHYDDLVFHDTLGEIYRGGIWDQEARGTDFDTEEVPTPQESDAASSIANDIDLDKSAPSAAKVRLSNTINDFTKKLKKSKSSHTVALNEDQCLSDGSIVDTNKNPEGESDTHDSSISKKSMNTLKKIGQWYFKDEKKDESTVTQSPDMILNRRTPRKSNADMAHSTASSIFNQTASPKNHISSSAFIREGENVDFPQPSSSTRESVIEPDTTSLSFLGETSSVRGAHERDSPTSSARSQSIHDGGFGAEPILTEVTPAVALAEDTPSLAHSRLKRKPPPESLASFESDEKHDEINEEMNEERNQEAIMQSGAEEKDQTDI